MENKQKPILNGSRPVYPDPMRGADQSLGNQDPYALPIGLTKREYFAAMALQAMISSYPEAKVNTIYIPQHDLESLSDQAIEAADLLLKQLES